MAAVSDLIGRTLTPGILDLLARRMPVLVVATVDENGLPHTAPYNQVVAPEPGRLLLAVNRQDHTYRNLRERGLAMLALLEEGDVAVSIRGRARIVREQMETNCNLGVVEIEIEEIKRDNSPYYLVTQGIRTRLREEPFLLQQRRLMAELAVAARGNPAAAQEGEEN
ncbi:MAG: pyridoxamine 5'-phosphate oxidase family protein [Bacillota bacterium]